MTKAMRVPLIARATIQRINRVLAGDDMVLRTARGMQEEIACGHYYVVNTRINGVVYEYKDVDLEALARKLGVLKPYECVSAR
jgi:hypothetical protein